MAVGLGCSNMKGCISTSGIGVPVQGRAYSRKLIVYLFFKDLLIWTKPLL